MDICLLVGRNIKKLRAHRRLSQEELADRAGISRAYLSVVEIGQKNMSIRILVQIAAALEVKIADLFTGYK